MQQVADISNDRGAPPFARTPQQRGRRIELLLWISGVVLLCVAWAIAFQVIATMRASAISTMHYAEALTLQGLADSLQRCAADHAALPPAEFTQHCVASAAAFEDWQFWLLPATPRGAGSGDTSAAYNAQRAPPQLLADLAAARSATTIPRGAWMEGSSTFERNAQTGAEIATWTATNLDGVWWIIGVSSPLADVMGVTGIPTQGVIMVGMLGVATLIALLLLTVTATSVRRLHEAEQALTNTNAALESRVAQRTAELVAANVEMQQEIDRRLQVEAALERASQEVLSAYDATLLGWSRMLEVRENEVAGHSQRVADLTAHLARALGCAEAEIAHIRRGALLHDIGKMALPDTILRKAGALTEDERRQVQQHPILAYNWLNDIAFLRPALDIPYCHHERWNGSGYPRGLRGEAIPLAARIFSVVDVWDALLADRPYKERWTHATATAYLRDQAGALFDPHVVAEFIRLIDTGAP